MPPFPSQVHERKNGYFVSASYSQSHECNARQHSRRADIGNVAAGRPLVIR